MTKPTKFKSGFYTWKIIWSEEKVEDCFGKTDIGTKSIVMYSQDNSEIERETLLHELLHVALDDKCEAIFGYEGGKLEDKEENMIRLLSPVMMQILSDNPELHNFLFGRRNERKRKPKKTS